MVRNGYRSKQDFAEKCGFNYGSLTHINSDALSLQYAARIASSLNVSLEQLFIKQN
jgi:DNA-binding XRE family transcriptional regulator